VGEQKTAKNHRRCTGIKGAPWRCVGMKKVLEVRWNGREKSENEVSENGVSER